MLNDESKSEIVKLNIGGFRYTTSKATLTQSSSFFSALVEGKLSSTKDDNGAYFIDRDGQYFGPILEFLRTGDLVIPPSMEARSVLREASFYCVKLEDDYVSGGNVPIMDGGLYFCINPGKENDEYFYFQKDQNRVLCQSFRSNLPLWQIDHQTTSGSFLSIRASGLSFHLVFLDGLLYSSSKPCRFKHGNLGTFDLDKVYKDKEDRCILFSDEKTLYIYDRHDFGWCCCSFQRNKRNTLYFEVSNQNRTKESPTVFWLVPFGSVLVLINDRQIGTIFL